MFGLHRILKTRLQKVSRVKRITVAELNYDSSVCIDLIDWHQADITDLLMLELRISLDSMKL